MTTTTAQPFTPTTPRLQVSDAIFWELCRMNPDLRLERTATGELIVNPPTGGETGARNFDLSIDFGIWNRSAKLGICFDSSTGFKLANGATRSPDVSWVQQDRWDALTAEEQAGFLPLAPDFVLELMSPSDRLSEVQEKMREWIENGVQLGWLLNRKGGTVEIYRPGQPVQEVNLPAILSGETVLPGFELQV